MSCGLFQSTHPSGVRQRGHGFLLKGSLFQSTHPSGVRHLQLSHLTYRFEISIHAPQWGATNTRLSALPCLGHFNPRTPVGCDRSSDTPYPRTRYYFNPRTPVGCDRNGWCPRSPQPHFNPRTPVGCDSLLIISLRTGHHFNPRTPVGCDEIIHAVGGFDTISIHAPQWGATDGTATFRSDAVISIHAPQWGATTDNQLISDTMIGISIHAPQWGATDPNSGTVQQVVFQSTHPSGVRPCPGGFGRANGNFNPRTPVGCDRNRPAGGSIVRNFNPRTPVGCDFPTTSAVGRVFEFQSTHPSGVRQVPKGPPHWCIRFQSTHPSGVRPRDARSADSHEKFQSTHPSGVRQTRHRSRKGTSPFQSTHPSGVRLIPSCSAMMSRYFNPRTPVGCDIFWFAPSRPPNEFQSTHPSGVRRRHHHGRHHPDHISIHAPQWGATARVV